MEPRDTIGRHGPVRWRLVSHVAYLTLVISLDGERRRRGEEGMERRRRGEEMEGRGGGGEEGGRRGSGTSTAANNC